MAGTFPSEKIVRENRPEYVLESFFYIKPWQVEEMPKWKMFLLDSGAFTFMHGVEASSKPVDWDGYLSRYIDFINRHNVQHFFELDVDIIVGYDAVKRMRTRLEARRASRAFPSGTAPVALTSSSVCAGTIPISASAASQSSTSSPASTATSNGWCSMRTPAGCGCTAWATPKRMQLTLDFIAWTAPHGLHRSILAACPTSTAQKWLWSGPRRA